MELILSAAQLAPSIMGAIANLCACYGFTFFKLSNPSQTTPRATIGSPPFHHDQASLIRSACCRPLLPPDGSLGAACGAAAAAVPDEVVEIFATVIVGYFLPGCDATQCHEYNPPLAQHGLCIRPAGMVHVTRHIPSRGAVDRPPAVELEHIFCATSLALLGLLGRNAPTPIGRDIGGPLDRLRREQAEPRYRTADAEGA